MRLFSAESFWSVARLWCGLIALVVFSLLGNAWQFNEFDKLLATLRSIPPEGCLVIAAVVAPGPLAHWLSRRALP
jgi:hypothetical protein